LIPGKKVDLPTSGVCRAELILVGYTERWFTCQQTVTHPSSNHINQSINQSINQKITTYKSDQWCITHPKTKIKPKDNVQKVEITQK